MEAETDGLAEANQNNMVILTRLLSCIYRVTGTSVVVPNPLPPYPRTSSC
jgi:hypothetical protein